MSLIFDTSIVIEIERGNKDVIERLEELRKLYPAPPRISFMTYFEFLYGLRKKSIKNEEKSRAFLELFGVIQTTNTAAELLVLLKEKYDLSLTDLFIASQVMETNGVLVTKDRDFYKIEEIERIVLE